MSSRRRRIVLSSDAQDDLRELLAFTQRQWGSRQRRAYRRSIFDAFDHLAEFPELGQVQPDFGPEVRGFRVGRHLIVYGVSDVALTVSRILHGRQEWPEAEDEIG